MTESNHEFPNAEVYAPSIPRIENSENEAKEVAEIEAVGTYSQRRHVDTHGVGWRWYRDYLGIRRS